MDCGGGRTWLAGKTSCATLVGLEYLLIFASLREVQSRTSPGIPPGPSSRSADSGTPEILIIENDRHLNLLPTCPGTCDRDTPLRGL